MVIGLDYDGTVSLDEPTFREFVALFKSAGHKVVIVTHRESGAGNSDIEAFCEDCRVCCVYTEGNQKDLYCERIGLLIDVWFDDDPVTIPSYDSLRAMEKGCIVNGDV